MPGIVTSLLLKRVLGWDYISIVHDGKIKVCRVYRSGMGLSFIKIGGAMYAVHKDGWLRAWLGYTRWKTFEPITFELGTE